MKSRDIKIMLWDFDGTLYKPIPDLSQERWRVDVEVVSEILHIPYKKAEEKLLKAKEKYKSTTKSMSVLGCGTEIEVLQKVELRIDRTKYLSRDEKLIKLFRDLSLYRHYIFSNILVSYIPPVLIKLGLRPSIFDGFITTEVTKTVKPDPYFFRYALKLIGLPPEQYLVIGDRFDVDLAPAKKIGMKTCLVWGKSDLVDISLPDVYALAKYLLTSI